MQQTIMAVGAHHDDNELWAGALARHRDAGWRVVSVVATKGRFIHGDVSEANAAIRENESRDSAKLFGMQPVFMDYPEASLKMHAKEATYDLVKIIREHQPQIIITHPPHDYHIDHMAISNCTTDAIMMLGDPQVESESPVCEMPALYYGDAWFVPFEPDEYVDITGYIDLKLDMLRCHKTQLDADDPHNGGMIENARIKSRHRGIECGVEYAEAYRIKRFLTRARLSPLLNTGRPQ